MLKKTLFISDLHLSPMHQKTTNTFLHFLSNLKNVDALYILGDLFDSWIGDDDETAFNHMVQEALLKVTHHNIPIYFLPGNRDFLIGKKFLSMTKCQLLEDEHVAIIYGTRILLMHGDTLCTLDQKYLRWRYHSHHPLTQSIFLKTPLFFRRYLAKMLRKESYKYTQRLPQVKMDVTPSAVHSIMQKHHVEYLIHGHTHLPAIHTLHIDNAILERIVLAAWHEKGSALVWQENGEKQLIYFD